MMIEELLNLDLQELGMLMKYAREVENRRRKAQGKPEITQAEMAKLIHISTPTISDWEQGKKHPGFLNVAKYCGVLGITPDTLLKITKQKQIFYLEVTQEERDAIFSMFDHCEHESEMTYLQSKLQFLKQYITALFSRAQVK